MTDNWIDIARRMKEEGKSPTKIAKHIKKYFPNLTFEQVRRKVYYQLREKPKYVPKRDRRKKHKSKNRVVIQNFTPKEIQYCWDGSSTITFGLVSDTHFNNIYAQITALKDFYKICHKLGVKDVYHVGDLDDGDSMRVGHQYELYYQGGDAHINHIVKHYPKIKGITTYFITGNHDASIYKRSGVDIGFRIAHERKDMKYLGPDICDIKLTDNCILQLRHPWDGTSYAISYKSQKLVESLDPNARPNILAIGHYHKQEYLLYHGIHIFQAGTFCAQTNYMKGKGISAALGGWIISIVVDKKGYLKSITPTFIPYNPIVEDYKNYL